MAEYWFRLVSQSKCAWCGKASKQPAIVVRICCGKFEPNLLLVVVVDFLDGIEPSSMPKPDTMFLVGERVRNLRSVGGEGK